MPRRYNINEVSADFIISQINKSGCKMLKGKLDGTETKEELIEYLTLCKCPKLKEIFTGVPKILGF